MREGGERKWRNIFILFLERERERGFEKHKSK
jgi:hypothetical protein